MVPLNSHGIPRVPWYSGIQLRSSFPFAYRAFTFCGWPFQAIRLEKELITSPLAGTEPYNPNEQAHWFRLFPVRSPLLRESLQFLFLRVLRCFTSPGCALPSYLSPLKARNLRLGDSRYFYRDGFPIRRSSDQRVFAPPRGLSQLTTSFFRF